MNLIRQVISRFRRKPGYRFVCDYCEQPHYPGHACPPEPMTEIRDDSGNVTGYAWTWSS